MTGSASIASATWPGPAELRIGLGCMRIPPEDVGRTVAAAVAAGVTVFDTARAYGDNERRVAQALGRSGAATTARVITKGGMQRPDGRWVPDGRAKAIRADCEASLEALGGLPIDLYLVHAPDPRTPWRTTAKALARLVDDGLVRRVGVANVNRPQLDEALELAPVAAVEVRLSVFDDAALRGGVVERCAEHGIAVLAHSPLGGPTRAPSLARDPTLAEIAAARGVTPAQIALAWLLDVSPVVVAIPGARRPETARAAAAAAAVALDATEREAIARRFKTRRGPTQAAAVAADGAGVVLIMGIPGAGKSRLAADLRARGYVRLNRDEQGGSLRELAEALERALGAGARRVVLDNTYLTRASRSYVLDAAAAVRLPVRCVWLDTPLAQAQVNLVSRLLARFGALPTPEELRSRAGGGQGVLTPTSQMRTLRALEPPSLDEGFTEVERVPFVRDTTRGSATAVFVAARVLGDRGWQAGLARGDTRAPHLVFDWRPEGTLESLAPLVARVAAEVEGPVEGAVCPHGGGPPTCWCRPPLPGLPLVFAQAHDVDPARSTLVGCAPAHRALAEALGARYVAA